jgi:HEAT repeat protein
VWILGDTNHPKAIPTLLEMLKDQDNNVVWMAAEALVKMGKNMKRTTTREGKALQTIAPYLTKKEHPETVQKAYEYALRKNVDDKTVRLYIKQLRAHEGNLK